MSLKTKIPLYLQVMLGVGIGTLLGLIFGEQPYLGGLICNESLGQLGMLVIRLLKTLATPLIFLAILDAFMRTEIKIRHAGQLIMICTINLSVAMLIGLSIINGFTPGASWTGHIQDLSAQLQQELSKISLKAPLEGIGLDPLKNLSGYIPETIIEPFSKNNVISVILLALLTGGALRYLKQDPANAENLGLRQLENLITAAYQLVLQMLSWVILAIPLATLGVVAKVVGKSGIEVFVLLSVFLITMLMGLFVHSCVYYPLAASYLGKVPIKRYFGLGADAMITGFSTNSSLATIPITLQCLTQKLGISERSARLSTLIGTNLNNDGIILYEAMAALFLAQAIGYHLTLLEQFQIIAASVMVGVGIAGIPEAGLIALPLVLGVIGLSENFVITVIPLIATVDWIVARCRSVVNVMSDMLVAILLDQFGSKPQ